MAFLAINNLFEFLSRTLYANIYPKTKKKAMACMQKAFLMALLGYEACQAFPISRGNFGFNNVSIDFPLRAASSEGDYVDPDSPLGRNLARTCVRSFLTQPSVQYFMFLLSQCLDPHTIKWIENYGKVRNFPGFHGTGAFNTT